MFKLKNRILQTLLFSLLTLFLSACDEKQPAYQPEFCKTVGSSTQKTFIIGIHPLHNPSKLYEVFNPLAEYLSENIPGVKFRLEASKDYETFNQKIESQTLDFLLPNPYQTLNAIQKNYQVINKMGSDDLFKGIILVRKDQGITDIMQLSGKTIAYPAPTALAATMMPQYYLQTHDLDIKTLTKTLYVGSQESSILNVYTQRTEAAATWTIPWLELQKKQPEIAHELEVLIETDSLPNNSFMFHTEKVTHDVAIRVQQLLAQLHETAEGKKILEKMNINQVFKANNETYKPVINFIEHFKKVVGDNTQFEQKLK